MGDGDGWVRCARGHKHWGRHGAAGLLLRWQNPAGGREVLLQQRAGWSHEGGTWGVPGGARDSHEDDLRCAVREAEEEVALEATGIVVATISVDDHGGWRYTTVVADTAQRRAVRALRESADVRWVPEPHVALLPLHPGFGAAWPMLLTLA